MAIKSGHPQKGLTALLTCLSGTTVLKNVASWIMSSRLPGMQLSASPFIIIPMRSKGGYHDHLFTHLKTCTIYIRKQLCGISIFVIWLTSGQHFLQLMYQKNFHLLHDLLQTVFKRQTIQWSTRIQVFIDVDSSVHSLSLSGRKKTKDEAISSV